MSDTLFIDFSNDTERNTLWSALRKLRGLHRVEITRQREMKTLPQLRLYFGIYVHAFRMFLAEQGQPYSISAVDKMLSTRFLSESVVNMDTGEEIETTVRSKGDLSKEEMSKFIDNVHIYLHEKFGITVPSDRQFSGAANANHPRHA